MEVNKIYEGNCLEILKNLPDNSIDCCITSPPYFSLRSYNTKPQTWGGNEKCQHEWSDKINRLANRYRNDKGLLGSKKFIGIANDINKSTSGAFCQKCNAWRGELGNEPTIHLFVSNLCDIFSEIRRVLKTQGTCWVNIGDSYAGSNGNGYKQTLESEKTFKGKTNDGKHKNILSAKEKYHELERYEPRAKTNEVPAKSLCLIPQRFQIEMVNRGWICRNTIIWLKRNCMPASVKDRFTVDFEYLFFFTKSNKYFFKQQIEPINEESLKRSEYGWQGKLMENGKGNSRITHTTKLGERWANPEGRNKRCVWDITTGGGINENHYASYPQKLVETPIKAGCPKNGIVLDPFFGSGTTGIVAKKLNRNYIGIELNPEYIDIAKKRLYKELGMFL